MQEYAKRFLGSEVEAKNAENCFYHIIPVPYEASVSYGGGTAKGPDAILDASDQLELFNGHSSPGERGIFTHIPVDCGKSAEVVMENIYQTVKNVLALKKFPILLGGEHSITYGALKALKEEYGNFGIVQFDAHADLRNEYSGTKWSHASVMRRAVDDLGLPLVQLGNRAYCLEEYEARKKHRVVSWDAEYLCQNAIPENLLPKDFPDKVFITFDVDGLDPSVIPDTGTPVAGGLQWYQALNLAKKAVENRTLIGFDVVELAPREDSVLSDFITAQLTYALMDLV